MFGDIPSLFALTQEAQAAYAGPRVDSECRLSLFKAAPTSLRWLPRKGEGKPERSSRVTQ